METPLKNTSQVFFYKRKNTSCNSCYLDTLVRNHILAVPMRPRKTRGNDERRQMESLLPLNSILEFQRDCT